MACGSSKEVFGVLAQSAADNEETPHDQPQCSATELDSSELPEDIELIMLIL